ncbi:MAG: hypothetical protein IJR50_05580 [Treponema sp.]|nr:hypothetical protein [Treponema sp.]
MKKSAWLIFFLGLCSFLYSNDIKILKGKQQVNYYGFPFLYTYGLNYRQNDFELLAPYTGFLFDMNPNPQLDVLVGADFSYKNYFLSLLGFCELWNLETKPFTKNIQAGGKFEIGIVGANSKIIFGSTVEKKRWQDANLNKEAHLTLREYVAFDFMLLNTPYCESTAIIKFSIFVLPQNHFASFESKLNIPFTIDYDWGQSCFLYSGFYSKKLKAEAGTNNFRVAKSYNEISGRLDFAHEKNRYNNIQSLELEQRIYPARFFASPLNLFFSVFGNIGLGFTENHSLDFLWEVGGGIGFNLFGSVPFTFQAGINSDKNFIVYLGIVSKISHKP